MAFLLLKYKETRLDETVTLLTWRAENGVWYLITNASVSLRNPIFQRRFAEWRVIPLFCNSGRTWLNIMNIAEVLDPCAHLQRVVGLNTVEPLWKGQECLTKVAKLGPFPCTILYKSYLFYPSWQATSFERPASWVAFIEGFHCNTFPLIFRFWYH